MAPKIPDSDSDSEIEVLSEKKPAASLSKSKSKPKPVVKKRAAVEMSSSSEEEDVKPKAKATAAAKKSASTAAAKAKKGANDSGSSADEGNKPKTAKKTTDSEKAKLPPAKKAKKDDVKKEMGGDEKPKWQFKPRAGPANPGSKDIPVGEENCLAGLTFVFTGELESLSREDAIDLAKRYGGRVTTAPSSRTSYVVLGSDAGPKKLEVIAKHKIKTLTEDDFLRMIGTNKSKDDDPKVKEAKQKEEEKIKAMSKDMALTKDAPEHLTQLWTTKYAPRKLTEICGNKGMVEKLGKWLELWPKSVACGFKKPGPDAMGTFRCVLISGPPGIGKTTAAHLVANMQGYDVLELNASDTRSKKLLESAFASKITDTTLSGFLKPTSTSSPDSAGLGINHKSIIIMDEVDGMSAGDRGGVGALNAVIKKTKVPIIAICNDKSSAKMKPLMNTCFQMSFKRPSANEIRSRIMSIAFKEGLKIDGKVVDQLVQGSQSDIRQIVNMLATYKLGAKALDYDQSKHLSKMNEKNTIQTPWTLYSKIFGPQAGSAVSGMTLNDKLDVYFHDHAMMPLFVQENYLKGRFSRASAAAGPDLALTNLDLVTKAAEAISDGDLVDSMIHGTQQQWSLMPLHGMMSCVRPASYCYGSGAQLNFPAWFGKNSTQGKLGRLLGEIQIRMRLKVSGDRREIRQSYLPTLFPRLVTPLQDRGAEAIPEVIELMDTYYLSKEDWDAIIELGIGEGFTQDEVLKAIPTATKSAFTRKYNASDHPIPFYKSDGGKAKAKKLGSGGEVPDNEDAFIDEDDLAEEEAEDEIDSDDSATSMSKDKLIKSKTKPAKKTATAASKAKAKPKAALEAPWTSSARPNIGTIVDDHSPMILNLPDEILLLIAEHFNPPIPFEMGHYTLPSRYTRIGRQELRALAATCRRFAILFRPYVTRTLTFQDRGRRTNTIQLFKAERSVQDTVQEVYWEVSHCYNDASPFFLPTLRNLRYLILAFLPQRIPDDELHDYEGLCTLRKSFTDALKLLPNLKALEIPFWEQAEDRHFSFTQHLKLTNISIGDWGDYRAFRGPSTINDVKFLVHPDIDEEDDLLEGFVDTLMHRAKRLHFAAYSGWGRTDLPDKLPETIRKASWYKNITKHPLETLTLQGFNPLTSYKTEWCTILPSVLSLLQAPNFRTMAFLDVPSMRNDDRLPLNWDDISPVISVEDVSIILAVPELEGELAEQAIGGFSDEEDSDAPETASRREEGHGGFKDTNENELPELSERLTAEELQSLLHLFPNLRRLTLGNFHRCGRESSNSSFESDFSEKVFQPAARDFISRLGIESRYDKLEQIVFRNAEAGVCVRFKRPPKQKGKSPEEWSEELRRLY
ncbi:replication factor C subunit 1 [Sporobolomyces koalae]|uniref:replication factor C subunit 1 n=1 Tax=Sporobolomyces koalae TaxID=500713 RepID=UPI00317A7907